MNFSHDSQSSSLAKRPAGASHFVSTLWLPGAIGCIIAGIAAGAIARGALVSAGAALLGALLCAFAASRLGQLPVRRNSWFIISGAQVVRAAGLALSGTASSVLLIVSALLLFYGMLSLARAASTPQVAQPDEETPVQNSTPFDWALVPDAMVIGGTVASLAWWLQVEPLLRSAEKTLATQPIGLMHLAAAAHLLAPALLIIGGNEMRPIVRAADGADVNTPLWKGVRGIMLLGTLLMALAAYHAFWLLGGNAAPQFVDAFLGVAGPLLLGVAALWEGLNLAAFAPGEAEAPLDSGAARAFWLRNLAPLLFAGVAVLAAHRQFAPAVSTVPGGWGQAWWGVLLVAIALGRHALDSLLNTRQTFEDYRAWNEVASSLQRDVDTRTRQLSTLHAVAADLSNTLDSSKIISTALDRMMNALHADGGAFWLYRGEQHTEPATLALTGTAGQDGFSESESKNLDRRKGRAAAPAEADSSRASAASIRNALVEAALAQALSSDRPEWMPNGQLWHLVRAAGDDPAGTRGEVQRNALKSIHDGLERGNIENALLACRSLGNSFQAAHVVMIQWKGEVLGAMAFVRAKGQVTQAEAALMQSLALEVGSALQNAHLYQEAVRLADRDSLTDLLNHRAAQQQLNISLSRAARSRDQFVILMMDLNNFKFFNDTYGHQTGDEVLKRVAECLRQSCRISDIIGRYGGDEFIAILMDTDAEGARIVVNRIEQKVSEQALESDDGRKIPISLSFGGAIFPHDGDKVLDLLSVANGNVNEAKMSGGGFVVRRHEEESEELKALKDASVGGSFGVLDALVTAIDNKDNYTRRHSEDVARWAVLIARQLGFTPEQQRSLRMCGLLHDVGKIAVPDSILRKPGRLNDDEFKIMQQHPVFGALIVKEVPDLDDVLGGIRHHHERFDGKGYPDRLKGEEIPLFGRILAVPDCFSAMTTNRPYRQGLSYEEATAEIERGKGTQFDPEIADAFLRGMAELKAEEAAGKAPVIAPDAEAPDEAEPGEYGDSSYFMNIKPRSVMDAEQETAEQSKG